MKFILIALSFAALGALAFGLTTDSKPVVQSAKSASQAMVFGSSDGRVAVTLTCDALYPDGPDSTSPRIFRLIGSYIDDQFGLLGSAVQSYGTLQNFATPEMLSSPFVMDLDNARVTLTPLVESWAHVNKQADVLATFTPIKAE